MNHLDDWMLSLVQRITMRWIKKHKFTKHKYDFALSVTVFPNDGVIRWRVRGVYAWQHRPKFLIF